MTSAVVQLAIGMTLFFFLVGSACSFLNELVAAILNRRAIHLQRWLVKIFGDDAGKFLDHPLIQQLRGVRLDPRRDKRTAQESRAAGSAPTGPMKFRYSKAPSYISATTFATTLLSILGDTDKGGQAPATAKRLKDAIERELDDANLKPVLRALLQDVGGDVVQFQRRLEQWFDEEMDRLSGWYKRHTKWFLLLWGLGLAIALNLDATLVVRTLWTDNTLRNAVVAEAQRVAAPDAASSPGTTLPCPIAASGTTSTTAPDPLECLTARIDNLQALQLPIGWPGLPFRSAVYHGTDRRSPHDLPDWWLKALGLVITAFAAMQGGPFWFDLLGKLINLRLTGPPPARTTAPAEQPQPQPVTTPEVPRAQPRDER